MMHSRTRSLIHGFLDSVKQFPNRVALEVNDQEVTYAELCDSASQLSAAIRVNDGKADDSNAEVVNSGVLSASNRLFAVYAERTATAYVGILATLLSGKGYVPILPSFPLDRSADMLDRSGCHVLIVDEAGRAKLELLLEQIDRDMLIVLPDASDVSELAERWPRHQFISGAAIAKVEPPLIDPAATEVQQDDIAYLLFTSGSTGKPKGVMVAHRNATRFIDVMVDRYGFTEQDRFSQIFELVFDLSVFDMFVAWEVGGCVCCPAKSQMLMPAGFINDSEITVWFSVPSTALLMKKLSALEPHGFPSLRLSLFCGEALSEEVASAWSLAASNSIVENLYGPTELTLACTLYRWDPWWSKQECENGVVPIGKPYPGMQVLIVDSELNEVASGETGELLMTGPQLTLGYWRDEEKTAAAFVVPPEKEVVYYRTGDHVRRPIGDGPITYLGRMDHQLQIHGYRVELGEVEAALRQEAEVDVAIAIGWPPRAGGADHLVAFLEGEKLDISSLRQRMKQRLPHYMVPKIYHVLPSLPLNSNGKVDRPALVAMLAEKEVSQ